MGMVEALTLVRPRDAEALARLRERAALPEDAAPGSWQVVRRAGRADLEPPESPEDFGTAALSRDHGEAVYLLAYDGPAGELCGTFLYEHALEGAVVRALALTSGLWWPRDDAESVEEQEALRWRRVAGRPEPWEEAVVERELPGRLRAHEEERALDGLPPLSPAEGEDLLRSWRRLEEGRAEPRLRETALYAAALAHLGIQPS